MRFLHNFFNSLQITVKFDTEIQNCMLILIFGSKSGFGGDFGQSDTKTIILCKLLFGQTPLRNSIAMATTKVPGNQKLFERVSYMFIGKVIKLQLPTSNSF